MGQALSPVVPSPQDLNATIAVFRKMPVIVKILKQQGWVGLLIALLTWLLAQHHLLLYKLDPKEDAHSQSDLV